MPPSESTRINPPSVLSGAPTSRTRRLWKRLNEEYPRIKELAKTKKARICLGDEAGIRSDHNAGTTWGVKGKAPVVTSTGSRFGLNMISAVAAKREFRFMVVNGRVNAPQFLEFIKRLVHNADRPVFLIVDSHPVQRAKSIKAFAEENKDRFRLFHLPPNPPNFWGTLKNVLVYHYHYRTTEEAIKTITQYIEVFYNRQRRQARLGYLSPVGYLRRYYVGQAAA